MIVRLLKNSQLAAAVNGDSRNRKVVDNTIANTVYTVVNALAQLILVPMYLSHWSKQVTGEWSVLWAVPALLWCLEGGFAHLASSKATMALAAGEVTRARTIVGTIFYLQLIALAFINILGFGLLYNGNIAALFGSHFISPDQVRSILVMALIYMSVGFTFSLVKSVYIATDNAARGYWLAIICKALEIVTISVALSLGGRPVDMARCFLIPPVVMLIYGWVDISRRQTAIPLSLSLRYISRIEIRNALRDGLPATASQLATMLNLEGMTIAVFLALGPAAVVTVTSVRTVCRMIFQAVQVVNGAIFPEISRAFGAGNFRLVREFLEQSSRKIVWLALACTVGLIVFGSPVVSYWTRGAVKVGPSFLCLFASTVLIQSGWSVCASALVATNKHHLFSGHLFLTNLLSLGLAYVFCRCVGVNGVPLATLAGDGFLAVCAWSEFRKILPVTVPFRIGESLKFPVWNN